MSFSYKNKFLTRFFYDFFFFDNIYYIYNITQPYQSITF